RGPAGAGRPPAGALRLGADRHRPLGRPTGGGAAGRALRRRLRRHAAGATRRAGDGGAATGRPPAGRPGPRRGPDETVRMLGRKCVGVGSLVGPAPSGTAEESRSARGTDRNRQRDGLAGECSFGYVLTLLRVPRTPRTLLWGDPPPR